MRAKYEIERQLAHMKGDCATVAGEKAVWILALDWVLGDDAHRLKYAEWLQAIAEPLDDPHRGAHRELLLQHSLLMALERLR